MSLLDGLTPPEVESTPTVRSPLQVDLENGSQSLLSSETLKAESVVRAPLRDIIAEHKDVYMFACLTGIVQPSSTENAEHSISKQNLRYRIWSFYLHAAFAANCLIMFAFGVYAFVEIEGRGGAVSGSEAFVVLLQNLLIIPPLVYLRRELIKPREICRAHYEEAFTYCVEVGRRTVWVLLIMMVVLTIDLCVYVPYPMSILEAVVILLTFGPANLFLAGVFAFLLVEMRVSYRVIRGVENQLIARTLRHDEYLTARRDIDQREEMYPINWLSCAAVVNTIVGMVLIVISKPKEVSAVKALVGIIYIITTFGRQTMVLLLTWYEMAKVNAINEQMLDRLSSEPWPADEQPAARYDIYILLKEKPLGSSIFFFRPSKTALFLQMGSTVLGVTVAVFWALAFRA